MKLTLMGRSGIMDVYKRKRGHETWVPLYTIYNRTSERQLGEFRHKRDAVRFAVNNRNG